MTTIDIIIPTYNAGKTIEQCLRSIFEQTWRDFSIVVVDDGSTDDTLEKLKPLAGNIKIINQPHQGAAVARNRGAKETTAPLLLFCDADVFMKKNMLEKMHQALESHPTAAYAYSAFRFGFKTFKLFPFDADRLKKMPYIHTSSLIRRQHFPGFDESLKRFQDWDLWLTLLERKQRGTYIPDILFNIKSGGTMSKWLPKIFFSLPIKSKKINAYREAEAIIKKKHHFS